MDKGSVNGAFIGSLLGVVAAASAWQSWQRVPGWETFYRPAPAVVQAGAAWIGEGPGGAEDGGSERADGFVPEEDVERESAFSASFPAVYLTEEERELLLGIAQAEAGNQGAEGMALVMLTVLNRTEDERFPNAVRDVIFQRGQFSAAKNVGAYGEASAEALEALRMVEEGWDGSRGALYFEASWVEGSFQQRRCRELFTHGGHRFYK